MLLALICLSTVTSSHVTTSEVAASRLSIGRSRPIIVAKGLKEQLVYISANGAPNEVQLDALALALHASIVETDSETRIERTNTDRQRLRTRRTDLREKWISRTLDDISKYRQKALAGLPIAGAFLQDVDRRYQALNDFREGKIPAEKLGNFGSMYLLPSEIYAEKLLRRIGLRRIASLPTESTTVLEDSPVFRTLALPTHADLVSEFLVEQAQFSLPVLSKDQKMKIAALGYGRMSVLDGQTVNLEKTRVRVVASTAGFSISVEGFDEQGKRLFGVNIAPSPTGLILSHEAILARVTRNKQPVKSMLSPESAAAAQFARTRNGLAPKWLHHPEQFEPLDLFVREAVQGLALLDGSSRCFAMCVSDGLWKRILPCIEGKWVNVDGVSAEIEAWLPYQRIEKTGIVVLTPEDPEGDELQRSNRKALGNFARAMSRSPDVRLVASLFRDCGPAPGGLDSAWMLLAQNPHEIVVGADASRQFYRLLGAISDERWQSLLDLGSLTLGQLGIGPEFTEYLLKDGTIRVSANTHIPDVLRFVPDCVPNGPSADSIVEVRTTEARLVKVLDKGMSVPDGWEEYRGIGFYLCPASGVKKHEDGTLHFDLDRKSAERHLENKHFLLGKRVDYEIRIHFAPGKVITQSIQGAVSPDGREFTVLDLTDDERDQAWIDGQREAIQWTIKNPTVDLTDILQKQGGIGQRPPPP